MVGVDGARWGEVECCFVGDVGGEEVSIFWVVEVVGGGGEAGGVSIV